MKIRKHRWRAPQPDDLTPRPYQSEGRDRVIWGWKKAAENPDRFGHLRRQCAALATGLGKTHLMAMVAEAAGNADMIDHVVVAAHQAHLVKGAYKKFSGYFPKLDVGCLMGSEYRIFGRHITVVSVQSMKGKRLMRLLKRLKGKRVAFMLDEMHHITPDNMWGVLLSRFEDEIEDLYFLGVSATPERTDKIPFGWLLPDEDCIAVQVDIRQGTEMGFLAPIVPYAVNFIVDSDQIELDEDGDNKAGSINKIVNLPESREQFFEQWSQTSPDRQMVAFCSDIAASVEWAEFFQSKGISATWVASGSKEHPLDKVEKDRRIEGLKSGQIQILCNPCMLTEGFDYAALGSVALLGSCSSSSRFTQMVGRGTRVVGYNIETSRAAGKADCILYDAVGAAKSGLVVGVDLRTAKEKEEGEPGEEEETEGGMAPPGVEKIETISGSEMYRIDIYAYGAMTFVKWRGMHVAPLSETEVAVTLPGIDGGYLCIYANAGHGIDPRPFGRLSDALDYMKNSLHAGSAVWQANEEEREKAKKGKPSILTQRVKRAKLQVINKLAADLGIDHGVQVAPSEATWRAIVGGLGMLLELRLWLDLNGPWDPMYDELRAIYDREISR